MNEVLEKNKIKLLKLKFHEARYWAYIYKMIKKNVLIGNENKQVDYTSNPGIVFSFDDSFRVNEWYRYGKELFGYYDVKVTFNINAFHHFENQREFNQDEIDKLLELQSYGHEIAHHGLKHKRATEYNTEEELEKWINDDINSLFKWMEEKSHSKSQEKFKPPVTYAFPHFVYDNKHIEKLIDNKYFKLIRGHTKSIDLVSEDFTGLASSFCIDKKFLTNKNNIRNLLKFVKKSEKKIILTCHSLLPDNVKWSDFGWGAEAIHAGEWRISPEMIVSIVKEAKRFGLTFYTTSEIAGVATFIDRNFEKYIKEEVILTNEKWISIDSLSDIKDLDLSFRNITNLDGIQYFINLEKINLKGNDISDYSLLNKLKNLSCISK
jgi:peptidoglycan/xylan/chitin deacetylase (PgdA/CDA1 family)